MDFKIKELVWNSHGTHLALIGSYELAVIVFPRLGLTGPVKSDTIPPKSPLYKFKAYNRVLHVGKSAYDSTNTIRKVLFHPQSKHDNTLVILSSDSHLRVFELSLSAHTPEQDIELFPLPRRGYTVEFDIPIPISFTFGTGADWSIWSVFVLTHNGDIYILTPLMPTKCVVSRLSLTRMRALISKRMDQIHTLVDCPLLEKETCLNQSRWISDILGQITMGEFMGLTSSPVITGNDLGDMVTFKRPNKVRPTPELQGPVLFQPSSLPIGDVLSEADDIAIIDAHGVSVLVTTWKGGRVDIGILVDSVEGVWGVNGISRDDLRSIRVAAYECIDLPVLRSAATGILTSHNEDEAIFAVSNGMAWKIDFRGWLQELQKIEQMEDDEDIFFNRKPSLVTLVTDERYSKFLTC